MLFSISLHACNSPYREAQEHQPYDKGQIQHSVLYSTLKDVSGVKYSCFPISIPEQQFLITLRVILSLEPRIYVFHTSSDIQQYSNMSSGKRSSLFARSQYATHMYVYTYEHEYLNEI